MNVDTAQAKSKDGEMMRVEPFTREMIQAIARTDGGNGWKNDADSWEKKALQQDRGNVSILIAASDEGVRGYGSLIWQSEYPTFAAAKIPEISDLVTSKSHRGNGIATMLVGAFEEMAVHRGCLAIGIGVGLYADYGPAQRLYTSLGYRPDGNGVTYHHQPVIPGSSILVDDDLVLWMTKRLPS